MKFKKMVSIITMLITVVVFSCNKNDDPNPNQTSSPTVVSTDPLDGATNVSIGNKISATFSTEMDPSTFKKENFVVMQGASTVTGVVEYTGRIATFVPTVYLSAYTSYNISLRGVKDMGGRTMANDYTWNFTTRTSLDAISPSVVSSDPTTGAVDVLLNRSLVITFSEKMDQSSITTSVFTVKDGANSIAGTVVYSGLKATFSPSSNWEPSKIYTVAISTGAKDISGNALSAPFTFNFTTGTLVDVEAPLITSSNPLNNAIDVVQNKVITFTFNENMNPASINNLNFTLYKGTTAIAGTVSYSNKVATFIPTSLLESDITYTATILTGAKDLAGNALASNYAINFKTGNAKDNLQTVNLATAGNYVILAKTAINNSATSIVTGDLGLSPAATTYITGFALTNATGYATSAQVTGKIFAADMVSPTSSNLTTAVNDMTTAYNDAAGRPFPDFAELATGNIGGRALTSGLYKWSSNVLVASDITISGGADDIWIFQIAGNLSLSSAVRITLSGGAQAKNIFWQVAGKTTLGTTSHFEGNILCMTAIVFQTGASINGRALAQTAVVLDANTVTKP